MKKETRSVCAFRVNETERRQIETAAAKNGMALSTFVRNAALRTAKREVKSHE